MIMSKDKGQVTERKIRYWKIAPGSKGSVWVEQRDNNCTSIGWNELGDLRKFNDFNQLNKKYQKIWKKGTANQVWKFYDKVKPNHKIVASSGEYIYGLGTVREEGYGFNENLGFHHTIAVNWEKKFWCPISVEEIALDEGIKKRLRLNRTVLELKEREWDKIQKKIEKHRSPFDGHSVINGLLQAPRTEQEAIVLFSAMSDLLHMRILYVGTRYPDAFVQVKERGEWVTKSAEFELYSSKFKDHLDQYKKNRESCDMIICWEDDWTKKPKDLRVVELRKELEKTV
jgi:hypothetical protein